MTNKYANFTRHHVLLCTLSCFRACRRSQHHFARQRVGHLAFFDHRHAVHQHEAHPVGKLVRIVECGGIANRLRIEDHDIGPHALLQNTTIRQPHLLRRERAELADGVFER